MFIVELNARKTKTITLRVSRDISQLLEKATKELGYQSKSDYIREAVEELLVTYLKAHRDELVAEMNESGSDELVRVPSTIVYV